MARPSNFTFAGALTALCLSAVTALAAAPVAAQDRIPIDLGEGAPEDQTSPTEAIDILAARPAPDAPTPAQAAECDDEVDAGAISGQIIVCGRTAVDNSDRFAGSYADWLKDYGERSKNFNAPGTPDVAGGGIFRGPPSVSGLCFIPPCPKPAAIIVDVEALPPPPVGTDADRLARGLAPRGPDEDLTPEEKRRLEVELVLPPKPNFDENEP